MLLEKIGKPAMLEQTAEEATELAFACLKLARMLRGENPVHGRFEEELVDNLNEEIADIFVCVDELARGYVVDSMKIDEWKESKLDRMQERFEIEYKDICKGCNYTLIPMTSEPCVKCFKGDMYVGREKDIDET